MYLRFLGGGSYHESALGLVFTSAAGGCTDISVKRHFGINVARQILFDNDTNSHNEQVQHTSMPSDSEICESCIYRIETTQAVVDCG